MEDGNKLDPETQNPSGSIDAENPETMEEDDFEKIDMPDEIQNEKDTNPPKDVEVENAEMKELVKSVNIGTSEGLFGFLSSFDWIYNLLARWFPTWLTWPKEPRRTEGNTDLVCVESTGKEEASWISSWWWSSQTVGIFTESQHDCQWLVNLLRSDVFKCDVRLYQKPEHQQALLQEVSSLSRVIIYKSGGHSDDQSNPYDLIAELGKRLPDYALKNVRIVVGDLGNIESAKNKWGKITTGDSWKEPILYTRSDINLFTEKQELLCQTKEKLEQIVKIMRPAQGYFSDAADILYNTVCGPSKRAVGIFSRESQDVYQWLIHCEDIKRASTVTPCYISSSGYLQFYQDVSECSFGILYHSKNRGRINVTDVTDSLYDKELEILSETLGKQNVIVVIDDVDQCSPELQKKILENQPSISTFAQELFVFSKEEKVTREKLQALTTWIKHGESMNDKAESAP